MNEQLQKSLADVAKSLTEAANQVGTVAKEQLPLLVNEYLTWGMASAAIDIAFLLAALLAAWKLSKWARRTFDPDEDEVGTAVLGYTVPLLALFFCSVGLFASVSTMLQIYIAPRVYLLNQAKELVK